MDIVAHIRELLFGHDCVIVPGFGGFIGNYTPARIDKTTSTFYPPVKQISFNRNLNHNDGLLVGRVSGTSGLNYSDARSLVENFVEDIQRRLSKGEKIEFDHIGSFNNNHEGNTQFEPDHDANYHLSSYGLSSFQFMPLEGYDVRKRIIKHTVNEPVKQALIKKYLWRAAVIIPLVGALITIPFTTHLFKTKVESTNLNPLASVEFENNRAAIENNIKPDSSLHIVRLPPVNDPAATENKERDLKVIASPVNISSEIFCVITGSFQSEDNATALMKKLSKEGYSPELINGPNGFFRVSAMKCNNLEEAVQKKDSIGREYSGAWITRIK